MGPANLAYTEVNKKREPASNEVEDEDWNWMLSSDLYLQAMCPSQHKENSIHVQADLMQQHMNVHKRES